MLSIKKNVLILLLMWLSLPAFAQTYRSLLRRANDQYELKAYTQAIETYLQVLERKEDEPEALAKIADCFWNLNQMEEAAENYTKLVRQRNVEPKALLAYGHVLKALGRYEEAKNYYLQYAKTDPSIGNPFAQSCDFARFQQAQSGEYSVVEERVNSTSADFGPAFLGDQIVFASSRTDIQRPTSGWDGVSRSQLFISRLGVDGFLQPPAMLKYQNQQVGEGPASFTSDNRFVAYTRNNFISGVRQIPGAGAELNIYLAEVNAEGAWINERPFPHNTGGKTGYPFFTSDGSALFFASDRQEGYGGYDLYISYREGNSWTRPINLGPVVNTPGNELSPFFDGTNLYFSSDWHSGFGGLDIFLAEQSEGRWAKVSNVGQPLNSPRDDYGFIFDTFRNYGFLVSNRSGGRGAEDLYRVGKANENLVLKIVNASDGSPVPGASIDLSGCSSGGYRNAVNADAQGLYSFPFTSGMNCELVITKEGYLESRVQLSDAALQNGRELQVALTRRGEEYFGNVISSRTGQPLSGVVVSVRNLNSGSTTSVFSDRSGQYFLSLSANTTYLLTYSAQGYRELSRNVNTFDGFNRNILGVTPLVTFDEPTPGPDPGPTPTPNMQGFAIQVSAMSKNPDLNQFAKLNPYGTVYTFFENGVYKVRVGAFQTREEAQRQLPSVKKLGYSSAFIVAEQGTGTTPTPQPQPQPQPQPGPGATGQYLIQLGAYSNPANFNGSRVSLIGPIVDRKKGTLTLKLIGGFNTLQDARNALPQARQAGFAGAFVVEDRNGVLVKVN